MFKFPPIAVDRSQLSFLKSCGCEHVLDLVNIRILRGLLQTIEQKPTARKCTEICTVVFGFIIGPSIIGRLNFIHVRLRLTFGSVCSVLLGASPAHVCEMTVCVAFRTSFIESCAVVASIIEFA